MKGEEKTNLEMSLTVKANWASSVASLKESGYNLTVKRSSQNRRMSTEKMNVRDLLPKTSLLVMMNQLLHWSTSAGLPEKGIYKSLKPL